MRGYEMHMISDCDFYTNLVENSSDDDTFIAIEALGRFMELKKSCISEQFQVI